MTPQPMSVGNSTSEVRSQRSDVLGLLDVQLFERLEVLCNFAFLRIAGVEKNSIPELEVIALGHFHEIGVTFHIRKL